MGLCADNSLTNVDDLVHFTLREWTRMSLAPTIAEVERAKSQTKAAQLLVLDLIYMLVIHEDYAGAVAKLDVSAAAVSGHRTTPDNAPQEAIA